MRVMGLVIPLILLSSLELRSETNRPGQVQFSNGDTAEGMFSLTPGCELKLHMGSVLKSLPISQVQEILLGPEKESMERKWRFEEAGRTEKKYWGEPYPVREIHATITMADGTSYRGHLYTTVLYLEEAEQTTKIVLRAKDKGTEGQTFNDLIYPVRITFTDKTMTGPGKITIQPALSNVTELVVLTPGALLRISAPPVPGTKEFQLAGLTMTNPFTAYKTDSAFYVEWSANTNIELSAKVRQALKDSRDFFDDKQLLGLQRQGDDVYSLLMLSRQAHTTLDQEASQPWRLEIWRWKDNGDRLMLAGRGCFFRGIIPKAAPPPAVVLLPGHGGYPP